MTFKKKSFEILKKKLHFFFDKCIILIWIKFENLSQIALIKFFFFEKYTWLAQRYFATDLKKEGIFNYTGTYFRHGQTTARI